MCTVLLYVLTHASHEKGWGGGRGFAQRPGKRSEKGLKKILKQVLFSLRREMVDDLRDLVVTRRRAADRPHRLEWNRQLVYGFILAPSYVVAS